MAFQAANAAKAAAVGSLPLLLYFLLPLLYPTADSREPTIIRPGIPIVGHVISMLTEWTGMFNRLYKERNLPICTLPMMGGKMYIINKPSLIAAAMRNRALSFEAFSLHLSSKATGMSPRQVELLSRPGGMEEVSRIFHTSLSGESLQRVNKTALAYIASRLNNAIPPQPSDGGEPDQVDDVVVIPHAFEWLRDLLALASMGALFGPENTPFPDAASLADLWEFDQHVGLLVGAPLPGVFAPRGLEARKRCQQRLARYYSAHHDQQGDAGGPVSSLIRDRAAMLRRLGVPDDEVGVVELLVPWLATTNTAPTLFWTFINAFGDADLAARIRHEMEGSPGVVDVTTTVDDQGSGKKRIAAVVDTTRLEKGCPTLHALYREALRLYSDMVGTRIVTEDTTVTDPDTGREYLLRGGVPLQWPSIVPHRLTSVWGDDAGEFRASRFLSSSPEDHEDADGGNEQKKQPQHHHHRPRVVAGTMIPFGGGRNLCPGRNLAQAEILGLVGAVALGFDVEGASPPPSRGPYIGTAMRRPDWGSQDQSLRLRRRKGWELVTWSFTC